MYMSKPVLIHIQPISTFGVSGARIFTILWILDINYAAPRPVYIMLCSTSSMLEVEESLHKKVGPIP